VDKLFLRELKVDTVIGFWEWERHDKQTVSIDIEIATDAGRAAATDSVGSALNYETLANRVIEVIGSAQFKLVETLAETVAGLALREFGAPWVKVSVAKPGAIRAARDVGIVIERRREDA
jgi:dihydroneopterin aldolase